MEYIDVGRIKRRPLLLDRLPIGRNTAHAIYPNIYVGQDLFVDVTGLEPNPRGIALVLHEQKHIERQAAFGLLRWYARYITSRHFRFREELVATMVQLEYLRSQAVSVDLAQMARKLSSGLYLWSVDYDQAYAALSSASATRRSV